jgi:hypothetical protein
MTVPSVGFGCTAVVDEGVTLQADNQNAINIAAIVSAILLNGNISDGLVIICSAYASYFMGL